MKLTVEQKDLDAALKRLAKVVPSKASIPMLQNVRLSTDADVLRLTATDLDIEVTVVVPCTVVADGEVTAPAKVMSDVVAKSPKGSIVTLDHSDHTMAVKSGRIRANIATLPADDFPVMANEAYDAVIEMQAHELRDLFDKTAFAASNEETRYYLNGVYLTTEEGRMTSVATDGHRLAKWQSHVVHKFDPVIVPNKTIGAMAIPDIGSVHVYISANKIKFATDDWVMVSKVIDGQYPNYERVIPQGGDTICKFSGGDMKAAVDRVGVVLDKTSNAVVLNIAADGVTISGNNGANSIEDFIDASLDGPDVRIGFNSKYIVGAMSKLEGNAVMQLGGAGDPAIVRDDADPDWLLVLMPMRVS